ncbi:MAG: polysaccharide deacetylase family protein [Planctomycetota bacterium]
MAKAVVRNLLAQACRFSGALAKQEKEARGRLTILCYHRVLPEAEKQKYFCPDLVVTPEAFRVHCAALAKHYRVLPFTEAYLALEEEEAAGEADKPLLAITFDDGYVDNLEVAAPILKEFDLPATFFIVSGLSGTSDPPWYDVAARCVQQLMARGEGSDLLGIAAEPAAGVAPVDLVEAAKQLEPEMRHAVIERLRERLGEAPDFAPQDLVMDSQQLRALRDAGHEIGSHSVSHEILTQLSKEACTAEVHDSGRQLAESVGRLMTSFCYPNGDHDAFTVAQVEEAGYTCAVTTVNGSNAKAAGAFTLKRRYISEQRLAGILGGASSTLFRAEVSGLQDRLLRREEGR